MSGTLSAEMSSLLGDVRQNGAALARGFFSPDAIGKLSDDVNALIESSQHIQPPRDFTKLPTDAQEGDLQTKVNQKSQLVDAELVKKGLAAYRDRVFHVTLRDPLIALPQLAELVFNEQLLSMASQYLGDQAAIGYVKVKRSIARAPDERKFSTHYFHVDDNAPRIFKALIYLTDVGPGNGQFTYVRGTHNDKHASWEEKIHWEVPEIVDIYGEDRLWDAFGVRGDLILADTKGFHRETPPTVEDRMIVIVNYVLEEEYGGRFGRQKLPASLFSQFKDEKVDACRYLEIV